MTKTVIIIWSACVQIYPLATLSLSADEPVKSKRKTMAPYQTACNAGSTQNISSSVAPLFGQITSLVLAETLFLAGKSWEDEWQTCHIAKENQKVLNVSFNVKTPL